MTLTHINGAVFHGMLCNVCVSFTDTVGLPSVWGKALISRNEYELHTSKTLGA